jgi:cbb3-type cytochrome oxidase subunit 3
MGGMATILTLLFIVAFFSWVWYAYAPRNKQKFEDAALLPFEEGVDR